MNKRIAAFLFAVGIGVASASAFAYPPCYHFCLIEYKNCIADGWPQEDCNAELEWCKLDCPW